MKFYEALEQLTKGKKIRLEGYDNYLAMITYSIDGIVKRAYSVEVDKPENLRVAVFNKNGEYIHNVIIHNSEMLYDKWEVLDK